MISENLPRGTGLSANAGPGKDSEWTPGGRGRRAGSQELGGRRQERSACLTTGLSGYGQGCSPRIVRLQHKSCPKKGALLHEVFARVLIFGARGRFFEGFWEVLGLSLIHI